MGVEIQLFEVWSWRVQIRCVPKSETDDRHSGLWIRLRVHWSQKRHYTPVWTDSR